MRKLMIVQWFGEEPEWIDRWLYNTTWVGLQGHGWDFLLDDDPESIRARITALGINCPTLTGRKLCDYRPALGEMYADEIAAGGFDFWGHTDLDCVYGRLWDYVTDELLAACDLFSNDPAPYMCGPFSLYRTDTASSLFRSCDGWRNIFESETHVGFDERGIERAIPASDLTAIHRHWHGEDSMYVHFRRPKVYPDLPAQFYRLARLVPR